jgi:hypothetical protein
MLEQILNGLAPPRNFPWLQRITAQNAFQHRRR